MSQERRDFRRTFPPRHDRALDVARVGWRELGRGEEKRRSAGAQQVFSVGGGHVHDHVAVGPAAPAVVGPVADGHVERRGGLRAERGGEMGQRFGADEVGAGLAPLQGARTADEEDELRVPLSYYRADAEAGTVELWYAVVGDDTRRLSQMGPGSTSNLLGPGGRGWMVPEGTRKALLVAGGIGVPPVLCLAGMLAEQGVDVDVCLGFGTASKAVGVDEFRALGATVNVCTDDGSLGTHGFCTDPAAELLGEGAYDYVASCGPAVMMKKVAAAAAEAGAYCEVSLERMMSCGFGACNTCNVETVDGMKGACMCGPVFDASKVVVF